MLIGKIENEMLSILLYVYMLHLYMFYYVEYIQLFYN